MTFEEDFPSIPKYRYTDVIIIEDVQRYCLDKQKVRDAIMKWSHKDSSKGEALTGIVHDLRI